MTTTAAEVKVAVFLSQFNKTSWCSNSLLPFSFHILAFFLFFFFRGCFYSDHHFFKFPIKWDIPVSTKANSIYQYSEIPMHYLNYFLTFHPIKPKTPDELKAFLWRFQSSFTGNSNCWSGNPSRQTVMDVSHTSNTFEGHNLDLCL